MIVVHADWGTNPSKQWVAAARSEGGSWTAFGPRQARAQGTLRERLHVDQEDGPVLIGFDFPVGLPRAYAARAGIDDFPEFLYECGSGDWADFFNVADSPDEITLRRPFYPRTYLPKGAKMRSHLTDALALGYGQLLRRCDQSQASRREACAIFWTCGGNQVGKGAISGWKLLQQEPPGSIRLWPFDGPLEELLATGRTVVAETYPTEFARQLGIGPVIGKRNREVRRSHSSQLLDCAQRLGIGIDPALENEILDGFGPTGSGEDKIDAVIGLLGMIAVVSGRQPTGEPTDDPSIRSVEGWMLGQVEPTLA